MSLSPQGSPGMGSVCSGSARSWPIFSMHGTTAHDTTCLDWRDPRSKERADLMLIAGTMHCNDYGELACAVSKGALAVAGGALLETRSFPIVLARPLALTWHIRTVSGRDAVLREMKPYRPSPPMASGSILGGRRPPCDARGPQRNRSDLQFETAEGTGSGVLRLAPDVSDGNTLKAGLCSRPSTN